ncbi:ABC transporter permease [Parachitinimonas caeni]|uniref:Transport permease protein n=1 Tax=Parachitinimonas caeni TaxID=3031301 RepID=A0ABT7DS29_9NEIS|nr:ABC transporter permease [Parachitinimonas caeni]MDK2122869.1 ABC transporter permease [Parachitinimonas caeni]
MIGQIYSSMPHFLSRWLGLRYLLVQLTRREIAQRYRGSWLGGFWVVLTPLLMLSVYTWVFSVVFTGRWITAAQSAHPQGKLDYALTIFVGLLVFQLFAECIARAPAVIVSNANYVKKVVFPLPLLPVVSLGAAIFNFCVGLVVWLILYGFVHGLPPITILALPIVLAPYLLLVLGLSWVLAATGVYLRDLAPVIQMVVMLLNFLSPIFYPLEGLPVFVRDWALLNPLALIIEQARLVMIVGNLPDWASLSVYSLAAGLIAAAGLAWFRFTRSGFADVL